MLYVVVLVPVGVVFPNLLHGPGIGQWWFIPPVAVVFGSAIFTLIIGVRLPDGVPSIVSVKLPGDWRRPLVIAKVLITLVLGALMVTYLVGSPRGVTFLGWDVSMGCQLMSTSDWDEPRCVSGLELEEFIRRHVTLSGFALWSLLHVFIGYGLRTLENSGSEKNDDGQYGVMTDG